jgi:hypothetical protein
MRLQSLAAWLGMPIDDYIFATNDTLARVLREMPV